MEHRRNAIEFCKTRSQLFEFPPCVVANVWSWALSFDRGRRPGLKVSLHENLIAKTERRISRWMVDALHESKVVTQSSAVKS